MKNELNLLPSSSSTTGTTMRILKDVYKHMKVAEFFRFAENTLKGKFGAQAVVMAVATFMFFDMVLGIVQPAAASFEVLAGAEFLFVLELVAVFATIWQLEDRGLLGGEKNGSIRYAQFFDAICVKTLMFIGIGFSGVLFVNTMTGDILPAVWGVLLSLLMALGFNLVVVLGVYRRGVKVTD